MLSFNGLSSVAASSVRGANTSSGKTRSTVSDLALDGGTTRQGAVEEVPDVRGVDTRDHRPILPPFTPPSLQSQIETEGEQSEQLQKALEEQASQEAIKAYTEKVGEIRAAAEDIGMQEDGSAKEIQDFLKEISEGNQFIHSNLTNFRQLTARPVPNMQFDSYPPSSDSEPGKDTRVALYNQAITAYMRQELFFSSISTIGHMVTI